MPRDSAAASIRDEHNNRPMSISAQSGNDEDDENIEAPGIEEIDDNHSNLPRKPIKRTPFKSRKMMGNAVYRGRDRIKPSEWCVTVITYIMIVPPSIPCLSIVPFDLAGWIGGALIFLLYWVSFINMCRMLHLCSTVEPGIIPKIRSKELNYQRAYKVMYRTPEEIDSEVTDLPVAQ